MLVFHFSKKKRHENYKDKNKMLQTGQKTLTYDYYIVLIFNYVNFVCFWLKSPARMYKDK